MRAAINFNTILQALALAFISLRSYLKGESDKLPYNVKAVDRGYVSTNLIDDYQCMGVIVVLEIAGKEYKAILPNNDTAPNILELYRADDFNTMEPYKTPILCVHNSGIPYVNQKELREKVLRMIDPNWCSGMKARNYANIRRTILCMTEGL